MLSLNSPIEQINPIAKKIAPKLKKLGVETVEQLLTYWPFRWEDWSKVKKIAEVEANTTATVQGQIELIQNKRSQWKKRLITEAIIADDSGRIKAIWFHQFYLIKNLKPGDRVFLSGKVEAREDGLQFVHPQYEKITQHKNTTAHTARIVPIYSLTKNLTSKQIRYLMATIMPLASHIREWLPAEILKANKLPTLPQAVKQIHFPDSQQNLNKALDRIKFNELFVIQLRAEMSRLELKKLKAPAIQFKEKETKEFVVSLPFRLTDAQRLTAWEILRDMQKDSPMNRLLEGDVGSGKTVVAALAIFNAVNNGYQAAYMAPTEILAKQHFKTLSQLFKNWPIKIGLLTGTEQTLNPPAQKLFKPQKQAKFNKKTAQQMIKNGDLDLVIGTHALIQDKIKFKKLALVIVDEQHRFGVQQRKRLKNIQIKPTYSPHFLSMTATPIPRTLALTAYGDLDLSIINQLPQGRKKIITEIVAPEKRPEKYQFILNEIKQGRQVFIVCPLIDPSDKLGVKAVKEEYEKLDKKIFPQIPIGLMHGRLKAKEKEKVMEDFLNKKTMILVSTPVIEVGIDVPNATIMVIESAERFGLAQLHQFRGRVGRGKKQAYCFLMTETNDVNTLKRLQAVVNSQNGFELAEYDLSFRGPGEVYGIKQSGYQDGLRVAKLTDYLIIKKSKQAVLNITRANPNLDKFPALKEQLSKFEREVHLE